MQFHTFYKVWTNIGLRQKLDKDYETASPDNFLLDNVWTNVGFLSPISVQESLNWTDILQTLDRSCTLLDRLCTFSEIGQTLDRVWTDIGQRLDFVSNLRPTNQG